MKKLILSLLVFSAVLFADKPIVIKGITFGEIYKGDIPLCEQSKLDLKERAKFEQKDGKWYYNKNYKYEAQSSMVPKILYYYNSDKTIKIEADIVTKKVTRIDIEYPEGTGFAADLNYLKTNYKLTRTAAWYTYGDIHIDVYEPLSTQDRHISIYNEPTPGDWHSLMGY